jgi:hypothetical protein
MSPELVEELARELLEDKTSALAEYRRLLALSDLSDDDRDSFKRIVILLGKKPDDLARDARIIATVASLRAKIAHANSPEFKDAMKAAQIAKLEQEEETRQILEARNRQWVPLHNAMIDFERASDQERMNRQALDNLETANAGLLGTVPQERTI